MSLRTLNVSVLVCLAATIAIAQNAAGQTSKPDPVVRDVLLEQWTDVGEKIIKMAEEFPDDKYDFRPMPGVRTFGDALRHVAFWNMFVAKTIRGEKVDPKINELSKAEYPTKATIVKILRSTLEDAAGTLKNATPTPPVKMQAAFITFIEHSGEHYGQLVVYYRLNGLVPPASRSGSD